MTPARASAALPPRPAPRARGRVRASAVSAEVHPALARGRRPRGCRAPARRVRGRRVRYHIGSEPGQINGRRWRSAACGALRR
ncbi:tryptophan synthase subunit(beta) [Streptomyces sp. AJS327]|uniref:tryptophan biosynthesis modulator TrpM n=1 Tax=Streptomyces sp. AJS327 TaxID=2545265 RepID=UPI00178FEA36|nr:tryptophan synthase subunit(beta) [Streptomyces sp. AJS327]MBA0050377.1 tryptophan synthase subunit(beta) [Streptomyces sp. AJS327]